MGVSRLREDWQQRKVRRVHEVPADSTPADRYYGSRNNYQGCLLLLGTFQRAPTKKKLIKKMDR